MGAHYSLPALGASQQEFIIMGLLDILRGMQNGPRGQRDPNQNSGGMSPITMAILALLAYKAVKHIGGSQPGAAPAGQAPSKPLPDTTNVSMGGGLGDLLKGPLGSALGGLLAGGAAGSILSGGLNDLLKQLQDSGHAEAANSWVGTGPNKQISANDLASALGADQISALTSQTGLSREDLLSSLASELPDIINSVTPDGRLPTAQEAARWI
jgi:uncharacterized protein YidB (DUF937 family)